MWIVVSNMLNMQSITTLMTVFVKIEAKAAEMLADIYFQMCLASGPSFPVLASVWPV